MKGRSARDTAALLAGMGRRGGGRATSSREERESHCPGIHWSFEVLHARSWDLQRLRPRRKHPEQKRMAEPCVEAGLLARSALYLGPEMGVPWLDRVEPPPTVSQCHV